jgi:hypothetical protein
LKKLAALMIALVILTGCTGKRAEMDRIMTLRAKLLGSEGCTFTAQITADYGDAIQEFTLYCEGTNDGDLGFRVEAPDTISGSASKSTSVPRSSSVRENTPLSVANTSSWPR